MRWLASAMVCSPEEQKRFTVMPGTLIGQPARIAIWRAMFQPVAPSGLAQPMITSSTSSASTFALSSAACTTWPPILAPWVRLSAPRQLLQSGVRAVETMTASVMSGLLVLRVEALAVLCEPCEQRRRLPLRALVALPELVDRIQHLVQPDLVGVEHRPAAVGREAVAGEVHHVDVGSAQRDAFLEDARAFVGKRVDAARDDLVVRDPAGVYPKLFPIVGENGLHFLVRDRLALALLVAVPAAAGLLPEPALLADQVGDLRVGHVGALFRAPLADFPADVVAR